MKIKEIHISKSRTINVTGINKRDTYRKIEVGITFSIEDNDYLPYNTLSEQVDLALEEENNKLKKEYEINNKKLLHKRKPLSIQQQNQGLSPGSVVLPSETHTEQNPIIPDRLDDYRECSRLLVDRLRGGIS